MHRVSSATPRHTRLPSPPSHFRTPGPHLTSLFPGWYNLYYPTPDLLSHQQPQLMYPVVTGGFICLTWHRSREVTAFHPRHKQGTWSLCDLPGWDMVQTAYTSLLGRFLRIAFFKINKCIWLKKISFKEWHYQVTVFWAVSTSEKRQF